MQNSARIIAHGQGCRRVVGYCTVSINAREKLVRSSARFATSSEQACLSDTFSDPFFSSKLFIIRILPIRVSRARKPSVSQGYHTRFGQELCYVFHFRGLVPMQPATLATGSTQPRRRSNKASACTCDTYSTHEGCPIPS